MLDVFLRSLTDNDGSYIHDEDISQPKLQTQHIHGQ